MLHLCWRTERKLAIVFTEFCLLSCIAFHPLRGNPRKLNLYGHLYCDIYYFSPTLGITRLLIFSCAATQEVPVPACLPVCLSVPDFEFRHKIVFTKPLLGKSIVGNVLVYLSSYSRHGLESPINFIRYCY